MDALRNLAVRIGAEAYSPGTFADRIWMPDAAPLPMPRQSFAAPIAGRRPTTSPVRIGLRRALVFGATLTLAFLAFLAPARIYAQDGFSSLEILALTLFGALTLPISCWFCSAVAGSVLLQTQGEDDDLNFRHDPGRPSTRIALLMPLYNEDAEAAFGRLSKIERSLADLDAASAFDIFVLSDSTRPAAADAEWNCFQSFRLTSHCRAFYRRRPENLERKAGNVADWVRTHGGAYAQMAILDADSTMTGDTLLKLADAMAANPDIGLIQTTPTIIEGITLYQRTQQFGVRLFGRVAGRGLAWWSGSESTYWGHNAIIRVAAFAACCGLPQLQGRKPFGGHIMSHDMVEAALLRRAGWGVHLTAALGGSYEETPPSLQAFMARDRRWCQGNMQHLQLLTARGLTAMSRLQMVIGLMAYWASPLWFLSLLTALMIQFHTAPKLEEIATLHGWRTIVLPRHDGLALLWMTGLTWLLLFGPKLLGALLVASRQSERAKFGGGGQLAKGVVLEMVMSMIMAPIMMVSHTRMLIEIFAGKDAGWRPQQRATDAMDWRKACAFHAWELRAGLVFAAALLARPDLSLVFSPIVLPLLFAPALSILTSRPEVGQWVRRLGALLTPEELGFTASTARPRRPVLNQVVVSPSPSLETLLPGRELVDAA